MVPPEFHQIDEMREYLHTPHLDALRKDSCYFSHCYSSSPLCAPSRASYLTGRFTYITGNSERSHDGHTMHVEDHDILFAEYLKSEGYHMRHVGKSHIGTKKFMDIFSENASPWNRWSPPWFDDDEYIIYLKDMGLTRFNFDERIVGNMGTFFGGMIEDQNETDFPIEATYPFYLERKAEKAFLARKDPQKKIYLQLDFFGPHQPFAIPHHFDEKREELRKQLLASTKRLDSNIEDFPHVYSVYQKYWGLDEHTLLEYRVANILQFELMDMAIGKFISFLKKEEVYEKGEIYFFADHGEMNGDKYLVDKGAFLNPKNTNVPLIYKNGKEIRKESLCDTPVSLLDIAPTILENRGITTYHRLDGQSLNTTIEGKKRMGNSHIMAEVWNHLVASPCVSLIFNDNEKNFMIVYTPSSDKTLLFALEDRCRINNLFDTQRYQKVSETGLISLHNALKEDVRWQSFLSSFEVEYHQRLQLSNADKQKIHVKDKYDYIK